MLLIVDAALAALIAVALGVASWRGRERAKRSRAARTVPDVADLIPGRVAARVGEPARARRPVPSIGASRATWSASSERGETTPVSPRVRLEPASIEAVPRKLVPVVTNEPARASRPARPAVVVVPRGSSWVVHRDGASRASSVHSSRSDAVARGRKTARRERVMLEVRDEDARVVDRIDYSAGRGANA